MTGKAQGGRMSVIVIVTAKKPEETEVKQLLQRTSCAFNDVLLHTGCSHLLLQLIRHNVRSIERRAARHSQVFSICASLPLRCRVGTSITQIIILLSFMPLILLHHKLHSLFLPCPRLAPSPPPTPRPPKGCLWPAPPPFCGEPCWDYIMVFLKFKSLTRFSWLNTGRARLSCFKGPALPSLLPWPSLLI